MTPDEKLNRRVVVDDDDNDDYDDDCVDADYLDSCCYCGDERKSKSNLVREKRGIEKWFFFFFSDSTTGSEAAEGLASLNSAFTGPRGGEKRINLLYMATCPVLQIEKLQYCAIISICQTCVCSATLY